MQDIHRTVFNVIFMHTSISDIAEYMGDGVTHIVTESKWDDNFDEVLYAS